MRNMSFFLTTNQFLDGSKDVTRRLGWKNLKAGDVLMAVVKSQGLKPGERIQRLGPIRVVSAARERLDAITRIDCRREGFPSYCPEAFVLMFCKHMKVTPDTEVARIEFERIEEATANA